MKPKPFTRCFISGLLLALLFFGVGWVSLRAFQAKTARGASPDRSLGRPIPVRTDLVTEKTFERVIGVTAETVASQTAEVWVGQGLGLRARRHVVKGTHVVEGQFVKLNQLLFELDDTIYVQTVRQQEAALAAVDAQREATEKLKDDAVASILDLKAVISKFEMTKLRLKVAQRDLESCQVRAPIEGFIDSIDVVLGEHIGSERQIADVLKLDPIHLRVDLPQERVDDVSIGQKAEVVVDSFPREIFEGTVIQIPPRVNSRTRTLPVVVEVANPDGRIKAGTSGFARLKTTRTASTIPATALIRRNGQAMVFCIEEGKARIRKVIPGPLVEVGVLEVIDGLVPGDEVVIYNNQLLEDHDPVDVDWKGWSGRE